MKEVVVGMDIGGTNAPLNFVDKDGNTLIDNIIINTRGYETAESFIQAFHEKIQEGLALLPEKVIIKGIGIGAPNGNYYKGTIEHAPNLKWKGIVPLADLVKRHYADLPVYITNDANAAAIGEGVFGGAKGMKDYIVITLGTGLGSGIVANGQMIYGHNGFAGELGHTIAFMGGRECGCGKKGCLEAYASATGIRRTVFELLAASNQPSELRKIAFDDLTAEMISIAAHGGDKISLEAYELTGQTLGRMLADFIAFSTPEAIFLFGGLANAGELIFAPTKKYMEEACMPIFKNAVKLLPSGLAGGNAAILGAAALVWGQLLNE